MKTNEHDRKDKKILILVQFLKKSRGNFSETMLLNFHCCLQRPQHVVGWWLLRWSDVITTLETSIEPQQKKLGLAIETTFPEDHDDPRWFLNDVCYRFRCVHCRECYTGETQQTLKKRTHNHWYEYARGNTEESALVEHHLQEHPDQPFKLKLLEVTPTRGFIDRRTSEAVEQSVKRSGINRRIEGERVVGNLNL